MATEGQGFTVRLWALLGLDANPEGLRFWEVLSIVGFLTGLTCIAIYAHSAKSFASAFGVLSLVGSAAWLSGGVLGFLFGVPRLRAATATPSGAATTSAFIPNTNLEQISDWLTKIIVGATLVQVQPLGAAIGGLATAIGKDLNLPGAAAVSGSVMILYFSGGFMWGYLWCSLRVFKEMAALTERENAVATREAQVTGQAGGQV